MSRWYVLMGTPHVLRQIAFLCVSNLVAWYQISSALVPIANHNYFQTFSLVDSIGKNLVSTM